MNFCAVSFEALKAFGAGTRELFDDITARIDARGGAMNLRFRLPPDRRRNPDRQCCLRPKGSLARLQGGFIICDDFIIYSFELRLNLVLVNISSVVRIIYNIHQNN